MDQTQRTRACVSRFRSAATAHDRGRSFLTRETAAGCSVTRVSLCGAVRRAECRRTHDKFLASCAPLEAPESVDHEEPRAIWLPTRHLHAVAPHLDRVPSWACSCELPFGRCECNVTGLRQGLNIQRQRRLRGDECASSLPDRLRPCDDLSCVKRDLIRLCSGNTETGEGRVIPLLPQLKSVLVALPCGLGQTVMFLNPENDYPYTPA